MLDFWYWILVLFVIVAAVFFRQYKHLKQGKTTKLKAIALFAGYSFIPVVLYGVVFFILAGLEEIFNKAIIGEFYARSLLIVLGGGFICIWWIQSHTLPATRKMLRTLWPYDRSGLTDSFLCRTLKRVCRFSIAAAGRAGTRSCSRGSVSTWRDLIWSIQTFWTP